jgi:DNA polymerase-3 subunit epsilon
MVSNRNPSRLQEVKFVAIDFETADHGPDSVCAIGLVRVCSGAILSRDHYLVRPPRAGFFFTPVHGITWEAVKDKPPFEDLWPRVRRTLGGVDFIASHNVGFDRRILEASCGAVGVTPPDLRYVCTMKIARRLWKIRPASLSNVARFLGLRHEAHNVLSDAEACAQIVLAAHRAGAVV